jgi:hypothetical protein
MGQITAWTHWKWCNRPLRCQTLVRARTNAHNPCATRQICSIGTWHERSKWKLRLSQNPVQPGRSAMPTQSSDPSGDALLDLIRVHRVTAVIHVTAKLGIADLFFEGPKTAAELSRLTDTHQRSRSRLPQLSLSAVRK